MTTSAKEWLAKAMLSREAAVSVMRGRVGFDGTDEDRDGMTAEDEQEMMLAQELSYTMERYRPPNAVLEVFSNRNLVSGSGVQRVLSSMSAAQGTPGDVGEDGGDTAANVDVGAELSPPVAAAVDDTANAGESNAASAAAAVSGGGEDAAKEAARERTAEVVSEGEVASGGGVGSEGPTHRATTAVSPTSRDSSGDGGGTAKLETTMSFAPTPSGAQSPKSARNSSLTLVEDVAALLKRTVQEADRQSVAGRTATFVPYNHWVDDALHLHLHKVFFAETQLNLTTPDSRRLRVKGKFDALTQDSSATLRYFDALGCNHRHPQRRSDPPRSRVFHTEGETITYSTGLHITIAGIFDRQHRKILLKNEDAILITAFVASQDGKYLAVAERLAEAPRVTLYRVDGLSEVLTLSFQYLAKGVISALSVSSNNRNLAAFVGPAEPKLVLFLLDEARVTACVDLPSGTQILSLQYNPWHSDWLAGLEAGALKLWKIDEKGKPALFLTVDHTAIEAKFKTFNSLLASAFGDPLACDPASNGKQEALSRGRSFAALAMERSKSLAALKKTGSTVAAAARETTEQQFRSSAASAAAALNSSTSAQRAPLYPVHLQPSQVFTAQCWFDEECLAMLTGDGCVVVVENGELVSITRIYLPPQILETAAALKTKQHAQEQAALTAGSRGRMQPSSGPSPSPESVAEGGEVLPTPAIGGNAFRAYFEHIVWVSRGVLIGGPGTSLVLLDRTYDERYFQQVAVFPCFHASLDTTICGMSVSPEEENVVVELSDNSFEVAVLSELDDLLNEFVADAATATRSTARSAGPGASVLSVSSMSASRWAPRVTDESKLTDAAQRIMGAETKQLIKRLTAACEDRERGAEPAFRAPDVKLSLHKNRDFVELTMSTAELRQRMATQQQRTTSLDSSSVVLPSAGRIETGHRGLMSLTWSTRECEERTQKADEPQETSFGILVTGDSVFRTLMHGTYHSATITGISAAWQLPYVATCGSDRMLRVYNFVNRSVVATRVFDEEVLSCAIHPSGLQVVIALEFFAKCYCILEDQFYKVAEMDVRGCHEVVFNQGGSRIAFSVGSRVLVYDAYSFHMLGQLVGHTVTVKSVSWASGDKRIVTADLMGTICAWDASTFLRDGLDCSQNTQNILTARLHEGTGLVAAIGCNKHATNHVFEGEFTIICANPSNPQAVVFLRPGIIVPRWVSARKLHTRLIAFTKLSQTMFVGTPSGRILLYSWPVLSKSKPYDYIDAHSSEVLFLELSPDERYLFSVGGDNTMFVFNVEQTRAGKYIIPDAFNFHLFDDVTFGLRSHMDSYTRDAAALRMLAAEYRVQSAEELAALERRYANEMTLLTQARQREAHLLQHRLEGLKIEKAKLDKQSIQEGNAVEQSYNEAAESLETLFAKVTEESALRYQQLVFEKDEVAIRYESTVAKRQAQYQHELLAMDRARQEREEQLQRELQRLMEVEKQKDVTADAMLCQTVIDFERDVRDAEKGHLQAMKTSDDLVLRAVLAASVGDREVDRLKKEIGSLQVQIDGRQHIIQDLKALLDRRTRETAELKLGMTAKQEAINVAERKMQQMKHQLTALENLRFVLTHQFESLEADVEPKDEAIAELGERVVEIERDLNAADEGRTVLRSRLHDHNQTLHTLQSQRAKSLVEVLNATRHFDSVLHELEVVVQSFRDPLQFRVHLGRTMSALQERVSTIRKAQQASGSGGSRGARSARALASPTAEAHPTGSGGDDDDEGEKEGEQRDSSLDDRGTSGLTAAATGSTKGGLGPVRTPTTEKRNKPSGSSSNRSRLLQEELDGMQEVMRLQNACAAKYTEKRLHILRTANNSALEGNAALIKEAKQLRAQRRELQQQLTSHENALRDVRAALHRLAVKSRMLMITTVPESVEEQGVLLVEESPAEEGTADVGLPPPTENLSAIAATPARSTPGGMSDSALHTPSPAAVVARQAEQTPATVAKKDTQARPLHRHGGETPQGQPGKPMQRRSLPPIARSVTPTPLAPKVGDKNGSAPGAAAVSFAEDKDEPHRSASADLLPKKTWGGGPLHKKPSPAERAKEEHRQQLESMLTQLDENTVRMQKHKKDIADLRGLAQELLRLEEQRLLRQLSQTTVDSGHLGSTVGDAEGRGRGSAAQTPAADVTTAADVDEEPDWVVQSGAHVATSSATPVK